MSPDFDIWEISLKTGRSVSQPLVISLKYENKVTVKKFAFMKVRNSAKLGSILGGDFVGGEVTRYLFSEWPQYWSLSYPAGNY